MLNKAPCKNCNRRIESCHSLCKDYAKYRKVIDEISLKKHDEIIITSYIVMNALNIRMKTR